MKFIGPFVLFALAIAIFFRFTKPELAKIDVLSTRANELNAALGNAKALQETRAALIKVYNDFPESDRTKLNKFLPDSIDNVKLIIDINSVAARYNMSLRNTSLSSEAMDTETLGPDSSPYGAMRISFRVSGSYDAMKQFLSDLANSLRLVDIVSVSFRSAETDFYEYDITLRTYWLR